MNYFWRQLGQWLTYFGIFLAGMAFLGYKNGHFSHMSPEDLWERGLLLVALAVGGATVVAIVETRAHLDKRAKQ